MPAKSQKQRAFIYATKGAAWAKKHHFDNPGKLPARVGRKKKRGKPRKGKAVKKRKMAGKKRPKKKARKKSARRY